MAIKDIVKGICNITRCKYDVYTKERTDELLDVKANSNNVYTKTETNNLLNNKVNTSDAIVKGDIAIISGEIWCAKESGGEVEWDYPSGFNKDNCVVISHGVNVNQDGYSYGHTTNSAVGTINGTNDRYVTLGANKITIWTHNPAEYNNIYPYKVVLMKVS